MTPRAQKILKHRWWLLAATGLLIAGGGIAAARFSRTAPNIPTAEVTRGEFDDYVKIRGEVKAKKSITVYAPHTRGGVGDPQILKMAKTGAVLKNGDVVVEFDTAKQRETLQQRRSELKQAEAEIEQGRAQAKLQEEQDLTDLEKARYDVQRAKLEVSKAEILSKLEGEKNKLLLADAEQHLKEEEEKLVSGRAKAAADIEGKKQKREKSLRDVQVTEQDIALLTLRAPQDGMVTILANYRASGWNSDSAPPFKEGDRAWQGARLAEFPDISTLRVSGRVEEADRGRVKEGQPATVRVDAVPDKEFPAHIVEISPLAKVDFSGWPFPRNFDVSVQVDQADARVRPGMSATARVAVEKLLACILIPPEATFQKFGKTVAYVLSGSSFQERSILVVKRGESQVAVARGLKPGERVALKDPTTAQKQ
jgi:multidrug efflux pump subunit AcrA (membrane-fusion protein)